LITGKKHVACPKESHGRLLTVEKIIMACLREKWADEKRYEGVP
jgi:hypothetical protein